ncbi:MAG: deoxyribonuclease IV, partial [Thermoleophilia bacterium]|nr:deoxyribonuclease IV [Thermoleophilia bacterium]
MFGSHLSIAKSMSAALLEAERLGLDCVQVFTRNQQQWACRPFEQSVIDEWHGHARRLKWHAAERCPHGRVASHASYLANLASPNPGLYNGSIDLMRTEVERAEQLGIRLLVFHPGAHTTDTLEQGIARIAAACAQLLKETAGMRVVLCFENVAGQGSTVGRTFQELAQLRQRTAQAVGSAERLGFCIDTAHAHAAGYDLSTRAGAEKVLAEMMEKLGGDAVKCLHINDSKTPCGSRVDRHAHIGEGTIGLAGFAAVVNHPAFADLPKIMETPKEEKPPAERGGSHPPVWDQINAARLRALIGHSGDAYPAFTPIGPRPGAPRPPAATTAPKTRAASRPKTGKPPKPTKRG